MLLSPLGELTILGLPTTILVHSIEGDDALPLPAVIDVEPLMLPEAAGNLCNLLDGYHDIEDNRHICLPPSLERDDGRSLRGGNDPGAGDGSKYADSDSGELHGGTWDVSAAHC